MTKVVTVLGCGPAGLLAAHAFHQEGWHVRVLSRKAPSVVSGAMFLHASIPGITGKLFTINFKKEGTSRGYALNVYNDFDAPVSWDKFDDGPYPAWSLSEAYSRLWDLYEGLIIDKNIDSQEIDLVRFQSDLVVSTIPRKAICHNERHSFPAQKIWLTDDAPLTIPDNTIVYNGTSDQIWYRASVINGLRSTESRFSFIGAKPGYKPLKTNCSCHPGVMFLGRFGEWNKNVLLHQVFERAQRIAVEELHSHAM